LLTHDVTIWAIRRRKDRRKPYQLRWKTGPQPQSKSFLTRALADQYRADLLTATRKGEPFDTVDGLPPSLKQTEEKPDTPPLTWFDFVCEYVRARWAASAAKSRGSMVDALSTATITLVTGDAAKIDPLAIRTAVREAVTREHRPSDDHDDSHQQGPDVALNLKLLSHDTQPVRALSEPELAQRLWDALGYLLDGTRGKRDTVRRRRRVLNTALEYAVRVGELPANPLAHVDRKTVSRDYTVDRRVVANPAQVRELLTALSYVGSWRRARGRRLVAFFATLYYAGLRPAEAIGLRKNDCDLPESGWGLLTLAETRPTTSRRYTDSGEVHDRRGLKQRHDGAVREVPIPPYLVRLLGDHIETYGSGADGRIFTNERGGVLGSSTYSRAWREARLLALTPRQVASPLAGTAYDLRHAALSTWLNGGVDPTDVAERAGNSVEVLLKRYAKCLDGRRARNNTLIQRALEIDIE
jgi:integrase